MNDVPADPGRPSLRERKKQMTRQAILDVAERLFATSGYDKVTVAQIADGANISVKTLFTYFDSKEDLVFSGEDEVRAALVKAVAGRPAATSALEAMRAFLIDLAGDDETASGIDTFHKIFGGVPQLHSRMLLMYERFENALAEVLAAETGTAANAPEPRLVAAQLVSLLRFTTSEEARERITSFPAKDRGTALRAWIDDSVSLLASGLASYGARGGPPGRSHAA